MYFVKLYFVNNYNIISSKKIVKNIKKKIFDFSLLGVETNALYSFQ